MHSRSTNLCLTSSLNWGVYPVLIPYLPQFIEEMEVLALMKARQLGIKEGSPIILTGGTPTGSKKMNFVKIITLNNVNTEETY